MTDIELKNAVKKLGIISCLVLILLIGVSIFTLGNTKASLSIYDNLADGMSPQKYGIDEKELKQYLSVFANFALEESEQQQALAATICFEDEMSIPEENKYKVEILKKILNEMKSTISIENQSSEKYIYNKEDNSFSLQDNARMEFPTCLEIKEISKVEDDIEVVFEVAKLGDVASGSQENIEKITLKARIGINDEYEFVKYYLSSIEKI